MNMIAAFALASECFKTLIVIILSSSTHHGDVRRAYELGTNAFLVKPSGVQFLKHPSMPQHPGALSFSRHLKFSNLAQVHRPRGFARVVLGRAATAAGATTVARFYARLVPALFVPHERLTPPRRHQAKVGRG